MLISQAWVKLSYLLEDARLYRQVKGVVYDLLEKPAGRLRRYFDLAMIALVLSSVSLLVYGERHPLGLFGGLVDALVVLVLIAEYLLRLWVCNDTHAVILEHYERAEFINAPFKLGPALREMARAKWDFARSPLAIIDLLAIVPSLQAADGLHGFLLFRLFKLFRYVQSISSIGRVLAEKRIELMSLGIFVAFVVLAASSALYVVEADHEATQVRDMFDAIYLTVVTIATVGYGDITPQTPEGRVVAMVVIALGLGIIAFFTSIIIAALTDKLPEERDRRVFTELQRRGRHTILCGFGRVGQVVAQRLHRERERFLVIDPDPAHIELAKQRGYMAVRGRAETSELLIKAAIGRARRVLSLAGDDLANVYITLSARQLNPQVDIISRANNATNMNKLRRAGANHTVTPFRLVTMVAAELVGQPVAFELMYGMFTGDENIRMDAIRVHGGSILEGHPLASLNISRYQLILFGVITHSQPGEVDRTSIYRISDKNFHFNPRPEFRLHSNDLLVVFGHPYSVLHFRECVETNRI